MQILKIGHTTNSCCDHQQFDFRVICLCGDDIFLQIQQVTRDIRKVTSQTLWFADIHNADVESSMHQFGSNCKTDSVAATNYNIFFHSVITLISDNFLS